MLSPITLDAFTPSLPLVPPGIGAARREHFGRIALASEVDLRRRQLRTALRREAYELEDARSALDVLRMAGVGPGRRADVIVLDASGPTWANLDLLEVIASGPPVLALVDPDQADLGRRCLERGARAVLDLPIDAVALRRAVRQSLASRHLNKG